MLPVKIFLTTLPLLALIIMFGRANLISDKYHGPVGLVVLLLILTATLSFLWGVWLL